MESSSSFRSYNYGEPYDDPITEVKRLRRDKIFIEAALRGAVQNSEVLENTIHSVEANKDVTEQKLSDIEDLIHMLAPERDRAFPRGEGINRRSARCKFQQDNYSLKQILVRAPENKLFVERIQTLQEADRKESESWGREKRKLESLVEETEARAALMRDKKKALDHCVAEYLSQIGVLETQLNGPERQYTTYYTQDKRKEVLQYKRDKFLKKREKYKALEEELHALSKIHEETIFQIGRLAGKLEQLSGDLPTLSQMHQQQIGLIIHKLEE